MRSGLRAAGALVVVGWLGFAAAQPKLDASKLDGLHAQCARRVEALEEEYADAKHWVAVLKIVQAAFTALGTLVTALLAKRKARVVAAILTCAGAIAASFGGVLPDVDALAEQRSLVLQHQRMGDSIRLQLDGTPDAAGHRYVIARYSNCLSKQPDPEIPPPPESFSRGGEGGGSLGTTM
jgi:hypothetical protein